MKIFLSSSYVATVQGELLGYVGENNSRKIQLYGFETEGASRYELIFSYFDEAQYEVDITSGEYTIPASVLREPGTVDIQVVALTPSGEFIKKSNIVKGVIEASVNGESQPIPPYEDVEDMYEQILESAENAVEASEQAKASAEAADISKTEAEAARDAALGAARDSREWAKSAEGQARGAANSAGIASRAAEDAVGAKEAAVSAAGQANGCLQGTKYYAEEAKTNADISTEAKGVVEASKNAAESAATSAEKSKNDAAKSAQNASISEQSATQSSTSAERNSQAAVNAKTAAESAKTSAEASATSAEQSKNSAETASQSATQSATSALASANAAKSSETAVNTAKTAVDATATEIATTANEVSQNAQTAVNAKNDAESAKDIAVAKSQEIAGSAAQIKQNTADIKGLRTDVDTMWDIMGGAFLDKWKDVQRVVRAGQAAKQFAIGDQLVCEKTVNGETQRLIWDVIGIDHDTPSDSQFTHSLTLQLHDCYEAMQFSARQALFAFPDGLTAGTYHFTVGTQPWVVSDVGKTIMFTLTKDIPMGGQLVLNNAYNKTMIGATISAFANGLATTAIETVVMSEGSNGTDLGTVNDAVNGNIGSIQRALLGSNNYNESAIRQWLNSDQPAGFWTPQTAFDRPSIWDSTADGFLYGVDPEFLAVLGRVKKITALNNVTDDGGSIETVEKVFLPSRSEVYAGGINDGEPYAYYSDYSDLMTPGAGKDTNRIKYLNDTAQYWWLRSSVPPYMNVLCYVNQEGRRNAGSPIESFCIAPVVCIV